VEEEEDTEEDREVVSFKLSFLPSSRPCRDEEKARELTLPFSPDLLLILRRRRIRRTAAGRLPGRRTGRIRRRRYVAFYLFFSPSPSERNASEVVICERRASELVSPSAPIVVLLSRLLLDGVV